METISILLIAVAVILFLIILFKVLAAPIRLIFKLLINAGMGFLMLLVVNIIGGFFDFSLGISLFNAVVAGVLGVPGILFMIILLLLL